MAGRAFPLLPDDTLTSVRFRTTIRAVVLVAAQPEVKSIRPKAARYNRIDTYTTYSILFPSTGSFVAACEVQE